MTWLLNQWDRVRTGFWFIPGLLTLAAIALGFIMPALDSSFEAETYTPWLTTTPAAAGRTLSAFGGAIATASGVVFSTTIVVLSLTSQQFGPRLLRTFLSDRTTQVTLGAFIGTSLYCLLVMRVIREVEGNPVAPDLSVALATFISVGTLIQLIYFIHHIATKIQAPEVLKAVAWDLSDSIDRLFPERIGHGVEASAKPIEARMEGEAIRSSSDGYLQAIDAEGLIEVAKKYDLLLELPRRPGEFTPRDEPLAYVRPLGKLDDDLRDELKEKFLLGVRRTPRQDVECSIAELVEVAVRALSPGINDPFTAMLALDYLAASLARLAQREMPSAYRFDDAGTLRVIAKPATFESAVNAAFDQIRQYGRTHADVTICGLEALAHIAGHVANPKQAAVIRRQAEMFHRGSEALPEENDRAAVSERFARVTVILDSKG